MKFDLNKTVRIIGAGLAGSEAAWQCARRGVAVELFEMRPVRATPAHQTDNFAELVCSNSLKSESENTAPWLLKEEMRRAGSRCCWRLRAKPRCPPDTLWR
jgi:methylenetetrahydrofolate--tRNA-(uracil-5-)-methyltransferase